MWERKQKEIGTLGPKIHMKITKIGQTVQKVKNYEQ